MYELFEKYQNYIGGGAIAIILCIFIFDMVRKQGKQIANPVSEPTNVSYDEFTLYMKTLKKELRNLTKSMMEFNANQIKNNSEYKDFREKLFTKDIIKKNIIIDSVSLQPLTNTSDYKVTFGQDNYPEVYKNVIGFRLVKAVIPHTVHIVTDNNKRVDYNLNGTEDNFDLIPGSYTFSELGDHFIDKLNAKTTKTFSIKSDTNTYKYELGWSFGENFYFLWKTSSNNGSSAYRLFGAKNEDGSIDALLSSPYTFPYIVDQTKHFVDLVIPEIPDIACKMGSKKQIIDRIPLDASPGSLVYYESPSNELSTKNYFYPIKLSSLSIQLYTGYDKLYHSNNGDNYFEFELTIVENTKLFE